jgi:hypothetical protein
MSKGAFLKRFFSLTDTVQNTVYLSQQLGEGYLEVGALCIVQSSPADVSRQIRVMGRYLEHPAIHDRGCSRASMFPQGFPDYNDVLL